MLTLIDQWILEGQLPATDDFFISKSSEGSTQLFGSRDAIVDGNSWQRMFHIDKEKTPKILESVAEQVSSVMLISVHFHFDYYEPNF